MAKFIDLTGRQFGKLFVIKRGPNNRFGTAMWICKCECGNEIIARSGDILKKEGSSCGCSRFKHRGAHTRLFNVWYGMKQRCVYKKHNRYHNYGAKGIKICDEWLNDYAAFRDWALVNGYDEKAKRGECTLDRIDVDGDYEPSNCRWVSMKEQNVNKSSNHKLTYNGETRTLKEWADACGIAYSTIMSRLRYGWSIERALTYPVRKREVKDG